MSAFCAEQAISRKTFYAIRKRARDEGQAAALEPRTRRPATSPNRLSDEVKAQAIGVRAALEQSGLDHGPICVHEKMRSLKMEPVPSVASLARIVRAAQVARLEPKKKPRASYRRFVYPAPNACWQLDGIHLTGADGFSIRLIALLDPVIPVGAHVGQADCRAEIGDSVALTHWTQFNDTCTHLHVDVGVNTNPLLIR